VPRDRGAADAAARETEPPSGSTSGYWYADSGDATPVDVLNLLRRYRGAEAAMRARTRESMGMNETDLLALRHLLAEQRAGRLVLQRDLAEVLKISSPSVTALIDRLVKSGHVERTPHPTDRRAVAVVATAESEREVRETLGVMHQRMISVVDGMSTAQLNAVATFLSGMVAAVEERRDLDAELQQVVARDRDGDAAVGDPASRV
jgi:DNA-binding MarR family transcriptional regulator